MSSSDLRTLPKRSPIVDSWEVIPEPEEETTDRHPKGSESATPAPAIAAPIASPSEAPAATAPSKSDERRRKEAFRRTLIDLAAERGIGAEELERGRRRNHSGHGAEARRPSPRIAIDARHKDAVYLFTSQAKVYIETVGGKETVSIYWSEGAEAERCLRIVLTA